MFWRRKSTFEWGKWKKKEIEKKKNSVVTIDNTWENKHTETRKMKYFFFLVVTFNLNGDSIDKHGYNLYTIIKILCTWIHFRYDVSFLRF